MKYILSPIAFIWLLALTAGCSLEAVEPELFGSIEGIVVNTMTNQELEGVSVETTPATEAMITDDDGRFLIEEVPTGSYQIKVYKPNFKAKSVTVTVSEGRLSSAKILLEPAEDAPASFIDAEVTSWEQVGRADSAFVNVEYSVANTSTGTHISEFEVYFSIHTNRETFYFEINNTELDPGEKNFGTFEKYIRDTATDSITVSGVWVIN